MIIPNIRPIEWNSGDSVLLRTNPKRTGFIIENATDTTMYLAFSERDASESFRTLSLPAQGIYEYLPQKDAYRGPVSFKLQNPNSGQVFITELVEGA